MVKLGGLLAARSWIKAVLLVLISLTLQAQSNTFDITFSTTKATTLSGTAETLTVQHAAATTRSARFISMYMYCSVACTVTVERSGTAATTTANTIVNVNPSNGAAATTTCTAYNASNVGTGTVINVYNIAAGGYLSLDGSTFQLPAGILDNVSMRTSSITGNVVLQAVWREY